MPWEFVETFVRNKRDAVKNGFAMKWDKEFWSYGKDIKRVCYV